MSVLVSVITTAIPERAELLEECRASVEAQTERRFEHLVWMDEEKHGAAQAVNRLAEQAQGEWLLPLADDDLLLPGCLRSLLDASADADIVYSPPLVWGNSDTHFFGAPPQIPATALIRRELFLRLGGYAELNREEDRSFWVKAKVAGARFVRADHDPTWIYRFHTNGSGHLNKSYNGGHCA